MGKNPVLDQNYVRGALDEPDSEVARLILADAYEELGYQSASQMLRDDGEWEVDGLGVVRWICANLLVHGLYKAKVRFGKTTSADVPTMFCANCKCKNNLKRVEGAWKCGECVYAEGEAKRLQRQHSPYDYLPEPDETEDVYPDDEDDYDDDNDGYDGVNYTGDE